MSRIGKKQIVVPSGIKFEADGKKVKVSAKGKTLELDIPAGFIVSIDGDKVAVKRPTDSKRDRTMHGTIRSLVQNMVIGFKDGFQKKLEITGVGYKAQLKGKNLVLDIGRSHAITYPVPEGITLEVPTQTEVFVKGFDKQKVGQVAADIRGYYPPEPYKGKGIKYAGEHIRRKQGKSVAK
jgi:large subunit ribosomal protein L6